MHKKEGVYVPELIFGHLLTSSNYEDTQKKACIDALRSSADIVAVLSVPRKYTSIDFVAGHWW